jgi:hypothetical protein
VKFAVAAAILISASTLAAAQDAAAPPAKGKATATKTTRAAHAAKPLPIVIPQQFAPAQEVYASVPQVPDAAAAAAAAEPSACQARLAKIATFKPLPMLVGGGECGATDAVQMDAIELPDKSKVAVMPAAIMRCPMAEEIAHWVREDVLPTLKSLPPLRALDNYASYDCRGRNNVRAAQMSEHGRADALDVRDFKLADGHELELTDVNVPKDWREAIKASVCARFSTVLGPGSDGYHEEHIHLDLEARRNNYKICQWDVRVPPQVAKKDGAKPPEQTASSEDTAADDEALIPLEEVPLPRARPVAQIERVNRRNGTN